MSPRARKILFPILALIVCIGIAAALVALKRPPEVKPPEDKTPFVSTQTVELSPQQLYARSQGVVRPRFTTAISAQVSGTIVEVDPAFEAGGIVEKGALLARLDPFDYEVALQQAEASLASARASFILERAQGQVAEAEWARISTAKPSELGLRKPQQEQALAAVKAAEASLKHAQIQLARTRVVAPFTGIISQRAASLGAFVNQGMMLGEILEASTAEVRLPVTEDELALLPNGGIGASVTLRRGTGEWEAYVSHDEGVVDDDSRMLYLVAAVSDPYNLQPEHDNRARLPFGTFVQADLAGAALPAAVVLPRQAVHEQGVPVVAADNTLQFKPVTIARRRDGNAIVSGGLDNGDRVITSALTAPIAGMAVRYAGMDAATAAEPAAGEPTASAQGAGQP